MNFFSLKTIPKSGILVFLLSVFSAIVIYGFNFIGSSVDRYYQGDAFIVNRLGQIRGSIQRYSKLKLFCLMKNSDSEFCSKAAGVRNFVDSSLDEIENSYLKSERFSSLKRKVGFGDTFSLLKKEWEILKNMDVPEKFVPLSEDCWTISDALTWKAQRISEIKNQELLSLVKYIKNWLLVFLVFLILTVYFLVNRDLEKDVILDKLTSLYNRNFFDKELQRKIWICRKNGNPASLVVVDIDLFKKINDNYGHLKGDEVLSKVASIIKEQIRDGDIAFRYGGEEFIVVLPGIGLDGALMVADRIRKAVENADFGLKRKVTVSCGVAEYNPGEKLEQFVDRADKALYKAKNNGRNRCWIAGDNL